MNKIKKVVIPVAGKGTRFLPITKTISKTLLPIVDTPVIQYLLEEAVQAGIKEALIIIGYSQNDVINYFNTESTYVQKLSKDYEEIKYTLHPRSSEMENIEKMINCGDPSFGGAMYGCPHCGKLKFVPFRCHSRFCPSCGN